MEALDLQDVSAPTSREIVALSTLAELTGFPASYIEKELLLGENCEGGLMTLDELRKKLLAYLDSTFEI